MSPAAVSVFVIVSFIALIAFDVFLASDDIVGNTYSERVRHWGERWQWFPFLLAGGFGLLLGHWFL